jgi:hypothetical protein
MLFYTEQTIAATNVYILRKYVTINISGYYIEWASGDRSEEIRGLRQWIGMSGRGYLMRPKPF